MICSRSSMDRIQVCGTCDAGSIPAESTNIKILPTREYFYIYAREKANRLAFVQNRIGVAKMLRAKRGSFVTDSCRELSHMRQESNRRISKFGFLPRAQSNPHTPRVILLNINDTVFGNLDITFSDARPRNRIGVVASC